MKKVALYIPCFNAGKFLHQALEAIISQTYPIEEVLIVDDEASSDNTAGILEEWAIKSGCPIRLVSAGYRTGLAHARNVGVMEVKTEFVASLDADCVPEPDWLEKLMAGFTEDTIAGVGGKLIESAIFTNADRWRAEHNRQDWEDRKVVNPEFIFGHGNVFRKAPIVEMGGYDIRFRTSAEDYHLSRKLVDSGWKIVYEPDAVTRHLRTDTVRSLLDANFNYGNWGVKKGLRNTFARSLGHARKGAAFFWNDLAGRRWNLLHISLFYPFRLIYRELKMRLNRTQ
ncbi:MAG TPA: glycosyltransferase family 2 protein [Proteobacteria bacterium]|nr:glycosyltransferase family 2 protein [Pseudomonadota bacterium]